MRGGIATGRMVLPGDQMRTVANPMFGFPDPLSTRDPVPHSAVVPSSLPLRAAICRSLQGREHNYLIFLRLDPRCMIGDLGVVVD